LILTVDRQLGGFGYLGGNDFVSEGGTPNLGFYDQRMALVSHYTPKSPMVGMD
jgi:carboxylesterase type B